MPRRNLSDNSYNLLFDREFKALLCLNTLLSLTTKSNMKSDTTDVGVRFHGFKPDKDLSTSVRSSKIDFLSLSLIKTQ